MEPCNVPSVEQPETAQQRFDRVYITSTEICKDLRVARSVLLGARRRNLLPEPIAINGRSIYVWERAHVSPFVEAWRIMLSARRSIASAK